jgi:hypothetical protein
MLTDIRRLQDFPPRPLLNPTHPNGSSARSQRRIEDEQRSAEIVVYFSLPASSREDEFFVATAQHCTHVACA